MRCVRAHGDGPGPLRVRTPGVQICITLRSVLDAAFCNRHYRHCVYPRNSYSMVFELLLLRVLYEYTCLS